MTSACGCSAEAPTAEELDAQPEPWWRDRELLFPIASGVALALAFIIDVGWAGAPAVDAGIPVIGAVGPALALYWLALLLGASQFVPGAVKGLVTQRRLGIGLLMTISAIGAVILGFVEEAATLAFLYSIAEALEDKAMQRARRGLRSLLKLLPEHATLVENSCCGGKSHRDIPVDDIVPGDVLLIRAGERIPTDATLLGATATIDASAVTGESIPVAVDEGGALLAGTINAGDAIEARATAPGSGNSLTEVVALVERAQHDKGGRARVADRIARPLVPGVLILAVAVAAIGSIFGDPGTWIERALVVLVAASPCALAISVPVTVISAIGAASRLGVVVKSGAAFERFGEIRHVAFDKTGTLTRNEPTVSAVLTVADAATASARTAGADAVASPTAAHFPSREEVLLTAAALERHSTHPLAAAITAAASTMSITASTAAASTTATRIPDARGVSETAGLGLTGIVDGTPAAVGSPRGLDAGPLAEQVRELEDAGNTVVVVHVDGAPAGVIAVRDELRPEAADAVAALSDAGLGVTMLTGDNARAANALAAGAGIADVRAELSPAAKAAAVGTLGERGPVAMIGDGINDAPALASADVGIAMGATGSDAAVESADVAFMGHDLRTLPAAMAHARRGRRIMTQNIALSLLIIVGLLPLALTGVLGLAAVVLVHEAGEIVVIANGLRAARGGAIRGVA